MRSNKLKSAIFAATSVAVAMSVGFAASAYAADPVDPPTGGGGGGGNPPQNSYTIASNINSVERNGDAVVLTTNAPIGTVSSTFVNGEHIETGSWTVNPTDPVPWEALGPCVTIDVTFRVYDESYVAQVKNFSDPYEDSVTVQWIGDNTVDCNPAWGGSPLAASGESLAKTGSDASTVAGLTGVAGVAALAIAVAVARRSRRAQR
jgi:hypothetical protein